MTTSLIVVLTLVVPPCQASNQTSADGRRDGWVSQPNGRGTFDILWGCLFTVFLCTWTVLHLNIPAGHETYWHQIRRKLRWMIQAIMAPEFVLGFATGQKVEALRSVQAFHDAGYPKWTMRHAFYANMGGFVLEPRGWCSFPVNAKQILYLVQQRYIDYPTMTEEQVWDKSKADGFQKTLTCLQSGWFIVQTIGRAIDHLPVTTLELTTLSFVFCNLAMYFQWANKPLDVQSSSKIYSDFTIHEILINAGHKASKPYRQTPLDFIDDQSPSWLTEVQPHLRFRRGPQERPLPRFTNDRFPVIGAGPEAIIFFAIDMIYCAIHFIGWNFDFPTPIEKTLWRASSLTMTGCAIILWLCETYQDGHRVGRWRRWHNKLFPESHRVATMSSMEKAERAAVFIPVWEVAVMIPVTAIYSLARTYIFVEIFLSQRSLPAGAFETVQWTDFIPHY